MTLAGWIFMIGSWAAIIALCVFCFYKVFSLEHKFGEEEEGGE